MGIKKFIESFRGTTLEMAETSARAFTRSRRYGTSTVIAILLVLAMVVFLEVLSYNNYEQFDLTKDKRFTVSPQTEKVLKSLDEKLEAVAFYSADNPLRAHVKDLLELYKYRSDGMFDYHFVDMDLKPGEAKEYNVSEQDTVVLVYGDRNVSVRLTEETLFDEGEKKLTNAVLKAIYAEKKAVYFLIGHGERDIKGTKSRDFQKIVKTLENQNYRIEELNLIKTAEVPEDASLLVIGGPRTNLFNEELTSITKYLDGGGSVLVTLDAEHYSPSLEKYLGALGVVADKDIVIDTESRVYGGDYTIPFVSTYLPHPITKDFDIPSFFFIARSLKIDKDAEKASGWDFSYLAKTGKNSWGETNIKGINKGKVSMDKGKDLEGPVPVVIAGTKEIEESSGDEGGVKKEAKMVVFGDTDFVNNSFFINEGNMNLFINSVNWLCDVEELIAIVPKDKKVDTLLMTKETGRWLLVVSFGVPLILIFVGAAVIIFRRRKA